VEAARADQHRRVDETLYEVRAVGFSPSGAALIIASSGEFTLITR
jgi:hypothetical protein